MAQLLLAALLLVAAQLSPVALCRVLCQPTASGDAASPPANTTSPAGPCPPPGFGPVADLDLIAYASAPWYVQKQLPLSYQPPNELYCVRAVYEPINPTDLTAGLIVNNYANRGAVNGPVSGTSRYDTDRDGNWSLIALPANPSNASTFGQLLVGPELLLQVLPPGAWQKAFGPYWVVATGPSSNSSLKYDWAIISGGLPTYAVQGPNGTTACSTLPAEGGAPQDLGGPAAEDLVPQAGPRGNGNGNGRGNGNGNGNGSGNGNGNGNGNGGGRGNGSGNGNGSGAPPAAFLPTAGAGGAAKTTGNTTAGGAGNNTLDQVLRESYESGGLWFFSRTPVDPQATAIMEARAQELGLDTSRLLPVQQEGCKYSE